MTGLRVTKGALSQILFLAVSVLMAPADAGAGSPDILLSRSPLFRHVPASATGIVYIDLEQAKTVDTMVKRSWMKIVLDGIAERLPFEQYYLSLSQDVRSVLFFAAEDPDGRTIRGWLVEPQASAHPLPGAFNDGTIAIVEPNWRGILRQQGIPASLRRLMPLVPHDAPIIGLATRQVKLPYPARTGSVQLALPGVAFALHIDFSDSLILRGEVVTRDTATDARGRLFVERIVDFLRPEGSFGPRGTSVAGSAEVRVSGNRIVIDANVPRETLLVHREQPHGPQLMVARGGHAAVSLQDGSVLFAGGFNGQRGLLSAEIFDPGSGQSVSTPLRLGRRRIAAASTLVGIDQLYQFYGMTGLKEGLEPPTGELLDLTTGERRFIALPVGPGRVGATATLLRDGRILICGGILKQGDPPSPDVYFFHPESSRFDPGPAMLHSRGDHAAILLEDGQVLLAGGAENGKPTASIELFDPRMNKFASSPVSLPTPLTGLAGVRLQDGGILVAGGFNMERVSGALYLWDLRSPGFCEAGWIQPRYYLSATVLPDGKVLLAGGGMGWLAMRRSIEIVDPEAFWPGPVLPSGAP